MNGAIAAANEGVGFEGGVRWLERTPEPVKVCLQDVIPGRDDEGRVAGSEGPQPVVRNLSEEAIRIYHDKLTIVDLRSETDRVIPVCGTHRAK